MALLQMTGFGATNALARTGFQGYGLGEVDQRTVDDLHKRVSYLNGRLFKAKQELRKRKLEWTSETNNKKKAGRQKRYTEWAQRVAALTEEYNGAVSDAKQADQELAQQQQQAMQAAQADASVPAAADYSAPDDSAPPADDGSVQGLEGLFTRDASDPKWMVLGKATLPVGLGLAWFAWRKFGKRRGRRR
ncbi:MAG TPA: hypothetical protein VE820_10270 [Sphingomicrobium sp.]|nr:hypothetical protein [Sphingomicrobium sp.]